jgi:sulfur carrier protein
MEIIINHTKRKFTTPPAHLEALLAIELPGKTKGIAIALNGRIVPLANWASTPLQNLDSILIITATQGG